jgi:hypothetical protein
MTNRMRTNSEGTLTVTGQIFDLKRFKELAKDGDVVLSVKKFIPSYEGRSESWELIDPEIEYETENRIWYKFNFSYSISSGKSYEPFLAKLGELFPMLIFEFCSKLVGRHIKKGTFLPNECGAILDIKGSIIDLQKFKEFAMEGEKPLSAEKFIPCPEQFENLIKEAHEDVQKRDAVYGKFLLDGKSIGDAWRGACEEYPLKFQKLDVDARDWCTENWGTWPGARNAYIMIESNDPIESENLMEYVFFTYSSPIKALVKKMGTMFPSLTFDYEFGSAPLCFRGHLIIEKGRIKKDEYVQQLKRSSHPK